MGKKNPRRNIPVRFMENISKFPDEACGRILKLYMKCRDLEKQIAYTKARILMQKKMGFKVTVMGVTYPSIRQACASTGIYESKIRKMIEVEQ